MNSKVKTKNSKLATHIQRFPQAGVLVIGDLILDHYIWGKVSRISPEAPVPVVHVESESLNLGGAAFWPSVERPICADSSDRMKAAEDCCSNWGIIVVDVEA